MTVKNSSSTIRFVDAKAGVLEISGVLSAASEADIERLMAQIPSGVEDLLLDFSGLVHMDSEGAGILVMLASRFSQRGIKTAACGIPATFLEVFKVTRLGEAMPAYANEREALDCLQSRSGCPVSLPPLAIKGDTQPPPGWAGAVDVISLGEISPQAMNINVAGRKTTGPVRGFGQLWDKRYLIRCKDAAVSPREIITVWRREFQSFWPEGNSIYPSSNGAIAPGTLAVLNLSMPGGLLVATGIRVIYVDDTSFSFITVQGHILSAWITFSSYRAGSDTIIQAHPLLRANDPLMELGFRLGAAGQEDRFWHQTLEKLGKRFDFKGEVEQRDVLLDRRLQWPEWKNIWHSASIRSSLYMPFYLLRKAVKG